MHKEVTETMQMTEQQKAETPTQIIQPKIDEQPYESIRPASKVSWNHFQFYLSEICFNLSTRNEIHSDEWHQQFHGAARLTFGQNPEIALTSSTTINPSTTINSTSPTPAQTTTTTTTTQSTSQAIQDTTSAIPTNLHTNITQLNSQNPTQSIGTVNRRTDSSISKVSYFIQSFTVEFE